MLPSVDTLDEGLIPGGPRRYQSAGVWLCVIVVTVKGFGLVLACWLAVLDEAEVVDSRYLMVGVDLFLLQGVFLGLVELELGWEGSWLVAWLLDGVLVSGLEWYVMNMVRVSQWVLVRALHVVLLIVLILMVDFLRRVNILMPKPRWLCDFKIFDIVEPTPAGLEIIDLIIQLLLVRLDRMFIEFENSTVRGFAVWLDQTHGDIRTGRWFCRERIYLLNALFPLFQRLRVVLLGYDHN